MTATPAPVAQSPWTVFAVRLQPILSWTRQVTLTAVLRAVAVAVTTAIAVLSVTNAATSIFAFAQRHDSSPQAAFMCTASVLGLYTVITACAWRARLQRKHLPTLAWVLWWVAVVLGVLAAGGAAETDTWLARSISAVPMASLAAITGLLTRRAIS